MMYPKEHCTKLFEILDEITSFHDEVKVSKRKMSHLPACFKKARFGFSHDCLKQWRGPFGIHIREYKSHYLIHRDIADPELSGIDAFSHALFDVTTPDKIGRRSKKASKLHADMQEFVIRRAREQLMKKRKQFTKRYSSRIGRVFLRFQFFNLLNSPKVLIATAFFFTLLFIIPTWIAFTRVGWEGVVEAPEILYQMPFRVLLYITSSLVFVIWVVLIYRLKTPKCEFYCSDKRECVLYLRMCSDR